MFYFTLPVFVFYLCLLVHLLECGIVISFELRLHSHTSLLHLRLEPYTSVGVSTSQRREPQLHLQPCHLAWVSLHQLYLFSRANLTPTWSAGPPIKLPYLMIWEWERVAVNPSDLLLALAIKKKKTKSTQQTNRTCTVIYYHGSRKCARISAHFQGKFLVKENSIRQGPQCFSDLRSPIQNHKNIQLPLRWLSSCKSLNTKWHTFVKKLRWHNISLKTYCLQEISRI